MRLAPSSVSITLKDLKVAKVTKKVRVNPCTPELEAYINAIAEHGGDKKIPLQIAKAFFDCSEKQGKKNDANTTNYHLSKFVIRK
eukprot:gene7095-7847_t